MAASKKTTKKSTTVDITGEPLVAPSNVHLDVAYNRNSNSITLTGSWDYPKKATDKKSPNRFEGIIYEFYCDVFTSTDPVTSYKTQTVKPVKTASYKISHVKGKKYKREIAAPKGKDKVVTASKKTQVVTGVLTKSYSVVGKIANTTTKKVTVSSKYNITKMTSFYPTQTKIKLDSIIFRVQGYNKFTNAKVATAKAAKKTAQSKVTKKVTATHKWDSSVPASVAIKTTSRMAAPVIKVSQYTEATRTVQFAIVTKDVQGNTPSMWYQTKYTFGVEKYKLVSKNDKMVIDKKPEVLKAAKQYTTINLTEDGANVRYQYDQHDSDFIRPGEKVVVTLKDVYAQGTRGDSAYATGDNKNTTALTFVYAYPGKARVDSVKQAGSSVNISFTRDGQEERGHYFKTDTYQLQCLSDFMPDQSVLYMTGEAAEEAWLAAVDQEPDSSWEDLGDPISNYQDHLVFVRPLNADKPSSANPYARTYYRVKAKNSVFEGAQYDAMSNAKVHPIHRDIPNARDETVEFLELVPEADGTSVRVVLAYRVGAYDSKDIDQGDTNPKSDACEISWSEDIHAWRSNVGPNVFEMPDKQVNGLVLYRDETPNWVTTDENLIARFKGNPATKTEVPKTIDGYSSKNPNAEEWYELSGSEYVLSKDTSVNASKTYYQSNYGFEFTSTAYIQGLTEGATYYFKARRFLEEIGDLPRSYGNYTDYVRSLANSDTGSSDAQDGKIKPTTKPTSISVAVDKAIPVGKDLAVTWTFEGNGTQTTWSVTSYYPSDINSTETSADGKSTIKYSVKDGKNGRIVKSGNDASGYCIIPYLSDESNTSDPNDVLDCFPNSGDEQTTFFIVVGVATSGDMAYSDPVQVSYVEPPVAYMALPTPQQGSTIYQLTQQPLRFTIGSDSDNCDATIRISAVDQTREQRANGYFSQPAGTLIYSAKLTKDDFTWQPKASGSTGPAYYYNVQIPANLPFINRKQYEVSLTLTDRDNGLNSMLENSDGYDTPMTARFDVQYEHAAPSVPTGSIRILSKADGVPDFGVKIILDSKREIQNDEENYLTSNPKELGWYEIAKIGGALNYVASEDTKVNIRKRYYTNSVSVGDVCDIYRVTPDGATLIRSDVSFGQEIVDKYAPFSNFANTRYRFAIKTPDGLTQWDDVGYNIVLDRLGKPNYPIRFDWEDKSLEIPFNLKYSDTFKKMFESRHHLGEVKPTGYWNDAIDRTSSFNTDIIKYQDPEIKETIRALAMYNGPVMVRRPDGCAYVANVDVNNFSVSYDKQTIDVSFSVTEIEMTDYYMISSDTSYLNEDDSTYIASLNSVPSTLQESPIAIPIRQVDELEES